MRIAGRSHGDVSPYAFLAVALFLSYARAPGLFWHPRFWAEEGAIYFAYAFDHRWYETLFAAQRGYFSLYVNAASLLAASVPLRHAPLVTTGAALLTQMVPVAIVVCSNSAMWSGTARKIVGLLVVLFTPMTGELWLNTINSQFFLSLGTLLVLLEPVPVESQHKRIACGLLLGVAGLTGAVSCFLTPLFLFKAWWYRSRESIAHAGILVVCSLVQILVVWSMRTETGVASRFTELDLPTLASIAWTNTFVWPFCGRHAAQAVARALLSTRDNGAFGFTIAGLSLFAIEAMVLAFLCGRRPTIERLLLVGAYALLVVLSTASSTGSRPEKFALIQPGFGGRYFYGPTVALGLLLFINCQAAKTMGRFSVRTALSAGLLVVMLALGVQRYWMVPSSGADWSEEVTLWQRDQRHALRIWPAGWTMFLNTRR